MRIREANIFYGANVHPVESHGLAVIQTGIGKMMVRPKDTRTMAIARTIDVIRAQLQFICGGHDLEEPRHIEVDRSELDEGSGRITVSGNGYNFVFIDEEV